MHRSLTDGDEGRYIASTIWENKIQHHVKNSDFAILYRTNAQSRAIEDALRKRDIPYRIYGGLSFYQRKEIKDVLSYLRLVINPADEEALKRVINFPPRGIGARSIEQLDDYTKKNDCSMWEAAKAFLLENKSPKISIFVNLIQNIDVPFQYLLHAVNAQYE